MRNLKVLVINCGSSSLKYQLYIMPEGINLVQGIIERIGQDNATLTQRAEFGSEYSISALKDKVKISDHKDAFKLVIKCLLDPDHGVLRSPKEIEAVAHRVVHGGEKYRDAVIIDHKVINDIEELSDLAPLHNPANLNGIQTAMKILPDIPHTATFDTAFHQTIPDYAYTYALPYDYYEKYKIRKYGFHGTSHRYVSMRALEYCKRASVNTNIISCHLGNGCSITAINCGKSIDTSMGFTPLEGLVMGTRSGDLDPAIIEYLVNKGHDLKDVMLTLNKKSGVKGIFGPSNDMRDIAKAADKGDKRAILALDVFAYRVKKYIGAYCAIMVKVDILVFTGGIGQNSVAIRSRICQNLENIGIHMDKGKNVLLGNHMGIISTEYSPITIIVIPTNEENQMAQDAYQLVVE